MSKKKISSVCPVCGSSKTKEWYKQNLDIKDLSFTYEFSPQVSKTFRVVRCTNCTHVFCDPIPKNIYKYYEDVVDEKYLLQEEDRKATAKTLLKVLQKYQQKGKLLDIGCATGDFLEVAREAGYTAEGIELSKWSSKIARKKNLKIYRAPLSSLAKRLSGKYDIVTLWGVIEHFEYLRQEMNYIHQIVKPGGILVVWTGDVDGIARKLLGRKWYYWMGQHIQYFSRKSLKLLGQETGFEEIFSKTYPQAMTYVRVANSLDRYSSKKMLLLPFRLVFALKPSWTLKIPGEIFWMAKKSSGKK